MPRRRLSEGPRREGHRGPEFRQSGEQMGLARARSGSHAAEHARRRAPAGPSVHERPVSAGYRAARSPSSFARIGEIFSRKSGIHFSGMGASRGTLSCSGFMNAPPRFTA